MQLTGFRIKNFKSIVDTEWKNLSCDNITGLVGQNESGKSSVLEALHAFSTKNIDVSAFRNDETLPEVSCSFTITPDIFNLIFQDYSETIPRGLTAKLEANKWRINISARWVDKVQMNYFLEEQELVDLILKSHSQPWTPAQIAIGAAVNNSDTLQKILGTNSEVTTITLEEFTDRFCQFLPVFELFQDGTSLLPDIIDYDDIVNGNASAEGFTAVSNFLSIAKTNIEQLYNKAPGAKKKSISTINHKITADFGEFWTQKIGLSNKIQVSFDLEHYPQSHPKVGKCYLEFFVQDGDDPLHPKQRSQGVRWFLSFYLQLKASKSRNSGNGYVLLIDEPGQSLHARAQEDVLNVFEDIKNDFNVIYTTHSPYLVSLSHLYRLLAVQRADSLENNSTEVIAAMHLGSATSDTLTPILTSMGVKIGYQNIIKKHNNIVLEEPSAYFYLTAFAMLFDRAKGFNFLPTTGADKIEQLIYLLTGWGIDYTIILDNDTTGQNVRKELQKNLFGGDEAITKKKVIMLPKGCTGIEEVFSKSDFCKHVVNIDKHQFDSNSQYLKANRISKPITAAKFKLSVEKKNINLNSFSKESLDQMVNLLQQIEERFIDENSAVIIRDKAKQQ